MLVTCSHARPGGGWAVGSLAVSLPRQRPTPQFVALCPECCDAVHTALGSLPGLRHLFGQRDENG